MHGSRSALSPIARERDGLKGVLNIVPWDEALCRPEIVPTGSSPIGHRSAVELVQVRATFLAHASKLSPDRLALHPSLN